MIEIFQGAAVQPPTNVPQGEIAMSANHESVVIVSLDPDAPEATPGRILDLLHMPTEPDQRVRWHTKGLVTVRSDSADNALVANLRDIPGVSRVVCVPHGRRLSSRTEGRPRQAVNIGGGVLIGDGRTSVMAGPCSLESKDQILKSAEIVAENGGQALRGPVYKPRSSPYQFGGYGEKGLEYIALARERTGLRIVTEVLEIRQVEILAQSVDVIQIGARNMSNFPLLFAAGANSTGIPVLLKRGLSASISEFLDAAEYVMLGRHSANHMEPGLILCERGIRTHAPALRFTLDVGAIPILKDRTFLPVIADPSHAAGERFLVPALARAALAAGADGLIVEVHPEPDLAWSDAKQTLDAAGFAAMMGDIHRYAHVEATAQYL